MYVWLKAKERLGCVGKRLSVLGPELEAGFWGLGKELGAGSAGLEAAYCSILPAPAYGFHLVSTLLGSGSQKVPFLLPNVFGENVFEDVHSCFRSY